MHVRETLTVAVFGFTFLAGIAAAQTPPPWKPLAQDRTITWSYPIDNATVGAYAVRDWGYIKDSLPHTAQEYLDGKLFTGPVDHFNGSIGSNFDDKIHTLTIVVTDSAGTFQKSVSFRSIGPVAVHPCLRQTAR